MANLTFRACLMALLVGALALTGCSRESEPGAAPVAPAESGSALTVLLPADSSGAWPSGLDPATNSTGGANLSLMNAIFGGLFQLTADHDGRNPRIVGVLAETFEIADEGRQLVIRLRPNLTFSDGTPLDAEAVRFNIERDITAPCACAPVRWPWATENRVVVRDPLTVELRFSRPYPAAIHGFPVLNINWIASPTALASIGEEQFRLKPVGAGPFVVVSNILSNKLVLERNKRYWQPGRPYLDRLVFQSVGSEQAAYMGLLAGAAQVAEGVTSVPLIRQAQKEGRIKVTMQPPTSPYVIQLNTALPPFNDKRAREAIYYATDAAAISKGVFGSEYPVSQSFTAPGGLFYAPEVPRYRVHDLHRARELVRQVGTMKVTLGTIKSAVAEQVVTALQTQWQAAGIDARIETHELATLVQAFQSRKWQAMLQTAGSYDPEAAGLNIRFRSGQIFSGVDDRAIDSLIIEAGAEVDDQRRAELYRKLAEELNEKAYAPFLFAFAPAQFVTKDVEGPGLTTRIPPLLINSAVLWQDVRVVSSARH